MRFLLVLTIGVCVALGGQQLWASEQRHAVGQIIVVTVTHRREERRPPPGRTGDREDLVWSVRDRHGTTVGKVIFTAQRAGIQKVGFITEPGPTGSQY